MDSTCVRVAAVQMGSQPGRVRENLEKAAAMIAAAVQQQAQLVLLPELAPGGYRLTEEIWECAEPWNGPICTWLTSLSRRWGIYLGLTFLEAEGEDFYNSFALATPQGRLAGPVRKSPPASLEAYFYRAGDTPHVLQTSLGRIGVGICYENLLYERLRDLARASVDLVLQPTAAGRAKPFRAGDVQLFDRMIGRIAPRYAAVLGVPVVLADQAGRLHTPLPGDHGDFDSSFPGLSQIVDADGRVVAKLGAEEGILVAEVHLDPQRRRKARPRPIMKKWAVRVPWYADVWPQTQAEGEQAYARNERRRRRALEISAGTTPVLSRR